MNRLLRAAAALACALGVSAAAQTLTVTGSHVVDSTGAAVSNATIYFAPVSGTQALSYRIGGLGQALSRPVSAAVTSGAFTITLPDTAYTSPANVCFSATVIDNVTGQNYLGLGYTCVQPSSSASWCGATSCNFDNFNPTTPSLTLQQGPPVYTDPSTGFQYTIGVSGGVPVAIRVGGGGSSAPSLIFAGTSGSLAQLQMISGALTAVTYTGSSAASTLYLTDTNGSGNVYQVGIDDGGAINWSLVTGHTGLASVAIIDTDTSTVKTLVITDGAATWS